MTMFGGISQNITESIIWENIYSNRSEKQNNPSIIGSTDDEIILFSNNGKKKVIQKIRKKTFEITASLELDLKFKKNKLTYVDLLFVGDKPIVITSFYNRKKNMMVLFYHHVDFNELKLMEPVILHKYDYNLLLGTASNQFAKMNRKELLYYSMKNSKIVQLVSSPNKKYSFLNFVSSSSVFNGLKGVSYVGKLFDSEFKELSSFEFKMPYKKYTIRDVKVSNEGVAYMLVDKLTFTETPKDQMCSNVLFSNSCVLFIDLKSGEYDVKELDLSEKHFSQVKLKTLTNGGVMISGLLNVKGDKGASNFCSITFDENWMEVATSKNLIPESFITSLWPDKKREKFDKKNENNIKKGLNKTPVSLKKCYINSIFELDNGSVTVLVEKYETEFELDIYKSLNEENKMHGNPAVSNNLNYESNIFAFNYSSKGKLLWVKNYGVEDVNGSYFAFKNNGNIEIMYNEKNVTNKIQLNVDGDVRKENFVNKPKGLELKVKKCKILSENEVLLFA